MMKNGWIANRKLFPFRSTCILYVHPTAYTVHIFFSLMILNTIHRSNKDENRKCSTKLSAQFNFWLQSCASSFGIASHIFLLCHSVTIDNCLNVRLIRKNGIDRKIKIVLLLYSFALHAHSNGILVKLRLVAAKTSKSEHSHDIRFHSNKKKTEHTRNQCDYMRNCAKTIHAQNSVESLIII